MTLLTTIIPVYNGERYIERAIRSALDQNVTEHEILVIDDGSTDNTAQIINMMSKKYTQVRLIQEGNLGVSAARNSGIKNATGIFCAFLDADDTFVKGVLTDSLLRDLIEDMVDLARFSSMESNVDRNKFAWDLKLQNANIYGHRVFPLIGHFASIVVKRTLLLENKILFDEGLRLGEDQVFKQKILLMADKIRTFQKVLYVYYSNPKSVMHGKQIFEYSYDRVVGWKKFYEWCETTLEDNTLFKMQVLSYAQNKINGRLVLYAQDYIRCGHTYKELCADLQNRNELELIMHFKHSDVLEYQYQVIDEFQKDSRKFVLHAKFEGYKIRTGRALKKISFVRNHKKISRYIISQEEFHSITGTYYV